MKVILFTLILLIVTGAAAQTRTNEQTLKAGNTQLTKSVVVNLAPGTTQATAEARHPRVTYSGPLVTVAKTKNPLELFDPWAPTESNGGETRVSHDLLTGRPNGVKLLTIRF